MKKVIILCSALVFDFLTCPEASAYNAKFEAADIETKLTELIGLVNSQDKKNEIVQRYAQQIKKLVDSKPQIWMGTGDLKIENNGTVQFIGKFNQPHQGKNRSGKAKAQEILREIQEEINQLKANGQSGTGSTISDTSSQTNKVTFNFENITEEDVKKLTQEQCQLAVKQGVIDHEKLFSGFQVNRNDKKTFDNIKEKVREKRGQVKQADNSKNYRDKFKALIDSNKELFKDVKFVKEIKEYLKKLHKRCLESYNKAEIKKGHPYLRFLIIDKI